ncbi:MAG: response regulator [Alphaproteobacteria bacterium]|nr:response regulator [Alphaproteobacteria bacterium]
MRFGTRLASFLVVVLIGVQALTVAAGHFVSRTQLVERGRTQLGRASKVFDRKLDLVLHRVADSVTVLSLDYPLREAIAHQDMATAASALRNHGRRIGAQRMFLVGLDGTVQLDTNAGDGTPAKFAFPQMLDDAGLNGSAGGMAVIDETLNWFIAVPVNAPVPIAYIAAVVPVDDALVEQLRDLDAFAVSIKIKSADGTPLAAAVTHGAANEELLQSTLNLDTLQGSKRAVALFEYPLADAVSPFDAVLWPLLIISLAGLAVAIVGAVLIARKVSRPIEVLADSARKIEGGDYTPPAVIEGAGEITDLSQALGAMARAINDRRTELQKSRDEAWRANKTKSEFLANMSHEIRTPLNAVLGLAGVLIDSPLNDDQRRQVALIKESGDNLLGLLNDILDLSKLDAGQVELENSAFDATALTRGSVELLIARATEKGIGLAFETTGDMPAVVIGDSARLRQVLINLIGNAIKFTQQGGVTVRLATTSGDDGHAIVEWSVVDSGVGIPAERLGSLFQEFVQADNSISRRFGGTGLGLAICKRLVERMGGTIDATSVLGQGSTFAFRVRLAIGSVPMTATSSNEHDAKDLGAFVAARGRGVRILVVEDNLTNQFVARSILKVDGIHIDVAANGYEAIEAVARHSYDLVLMDMQMPEMDGLTATRAIRARGGRFADLPIIAFSANAYARDIEACAAAGMNGHVAKPVQKETLRGAVIDALSGRKCGVVATPGTLGNDAAEFDRSAVDALIDGLTMDVAAELLTSFVKDSNAKIEQLPALLENYERLTIEVHALKSAGAQVGAMRLSQLSAALERRAVARDAIGREEFLALKTALDGYGSELAKVVRGTR